MIIPSLPIAPRPADEPAPEPTSAREAPSELVAEVARQVTTTRPRGGRAQQLGGHGCVVGAAVVVS